MYKRQPPSLEKLIQERADFLEAYQNAAYAQDYIRFVREVDAAERRASPQSKRLRLTETVARVLHKLMSYKDEYEVARLYTRSEFLAQLREQFEGDFTLRFNLAPPLWSKRNTAGELMKAEYGPWVLSAFKVLARLKFLRGTAFDPFGYTKERHEERRLILEYCDLVRGLLAGLTEDTVASAVQTAALAEQVRGFGHVKERNLSNYRSTLAAAQDASPPEGVRTPQVAAARAA